MHLLRDNARSLRNALDRARLRLANRVFETSDGAVDARTLSVIRAEDIRASRVFRDTAEANFNEEEKHDQER